MMAGSKKGRVLRDGRGYANEYEDLGFIDVTPRVVTTSIRINPITWLMVRALDLSAADLASRAVIEAFTAENGVEEREALLDAVARKCEGLTTAELRRSRVWQDMLDPARDQSHNSPPKAATLPRARNEVMRLSPAVWLMSRYCETPLGDLFEQAVGRMYLDLYGRLAHEELERRAVEEMGGMSIAELNDRRPWFAVADEFGISYQSPKAYRRDK